MISIKHATKNDVFVVLVYLFQHHMKQGALVDVEEPGLNSELREMDFSDATIKKAFNWLHHLEKLQKEMQHYLLKKNSIHLYTEVEQKKISAKCRSFLMKLENMKILDAIIREAVIILIMEMTDTIINLDLVKWVVLIVLYTNPLYKDLLSNYLDYLVINEYSNGHL